MEGRKLELELQLVHPKKAELALWQAWDFSTTIVCSFVTDISPSSLR
jgi:hypothetical protein